MSDEPEPATPEEIRCRLTEFIRGEIRLANSDRETVLESAFEVHVMDEVDESDYATYREHILVEFDRLLEEHEAESATWPEPTDCDRLNAATVDLNERGIVLWAPSPCCDTCTMAEFPDHVDKLMAEDPTLADRFRGYAFFIDQTMNESLQDRTEIAVFLGYGLTIEVPEEEYEAGAVAIGEEVRECLEASGLDVDWDGTIGKKIGLSLNWQKQFGVM